MRDRKRDLDNGRDSPHSLVQPQNTSNVLHWARLMLKTKTQSRSVMRMAEIQVLEPLPAAFQVVH